MMLNSTEDRLRVIDDFRIDYNLPKYKEKSNNIISGTFFNSEAGVIIEKRLPWWKRIFWRGGAISVEEFFNSIKGSEREIMIIRERAIGYERAILNAKKAGQESLVEELVAGLNAYKMETLLISIGLVKFVDEEDIIKFYKRSDKGLRLDWIKNFIRPIPIDIAETKSKADELGIFDNYVVLHYDPSGRGYAETRREKLAKKDPILFGLMKDRTQLYVIGDWVDEYCDLTLDKFAEIMGKEAIRDI